MSAQEGQSGPGAKSPTTMPRGGPQGLVGREFQPSDWLTAAQTQTRHSARVDPDKADTRNYERVRCCNMKTAITLLRS